MAHNFDLSSRFWYVAASGKLNIAMGLEIATFLAPQWFLPFGATANAVKGLAWMAGGSSRSAFNVSFAKDRNIADITAKATSQTICTSLIGTAAGMAIAASIEQSVGLCFGFYSALAAVHMYTAVESARSVPLNTLNPSRLKKLAAMVVGFEDRKRLLPLLLPTPSELAVEDRIFPGLLDRITAGKEGGYYNKNSISKLPLELVVGTSLQKLASTEPATIAALLPLYKDKKYILILDKYNKMHLVLHEEAKTVDAVTAVLQATAWNQHKNQQRNQRQTSFEDSYLNIDILQQEAEKAMNLAEKLAPRMVDALKIAGWDVQGVVIEPRKRRATW
jgi:Vitamin B6 photo-protection and homoeostasis